MTSATAKGDHPNREYAIGLARAFGGALIFGLPLLMTMEMWYFGFYLDRVRLLIFLGLNIFMLVGLSRFAGFEPTAGTFDDIMDALAAFAIGIIASAIILLLFNVLTPDMPLGEIVGKVAVQSVPASFGAMIARKQLSGGGGKDAEDAASEEEEELQRASYAGELFLMAAGALFLAFNVAPTEEMILIGFKMSGAHTIALLLVSILLNALTLLDFDSNEKAIVPGGTGEKQKEKRVPTSQLWMQHPQRRTVVNIVVDVRRTLTDPSSCQR